MKLRNVIFAILGLIFLYSISSIILSSYLSKRYDFNYNKQRVKIGLRVIGDKWQLDSIEFIEFGNYSYYERRKKSDWYLSLENEKLYLQHWSNNQIDTSIPYHKTKRILYSQSFWIWKNRIFAEYDIFINPKTKYKNEELLTSYDYTRKEWFCRMDTIDTKLKKQKDKRRIDSIATYIKENNLFYDFLPKNDNCYIDTIGFSYKEAENILKKWKL